jgi:hypothetical protein
VYGLDRSSAKFDETSLPFVIFSSIPLVVKRIKGENHFVMGSGPNPAPDLLLSEWTDESGPVLDFEPAGSPPEPSQSAAPGQAPSPSDGPHLNWLFVDLNSYFASVEQDARPELRGCPVAVVPMMADTTVCIAASYEAKAHGVRTGTVVADAKRMCPGWC